MPVTFGLLDINIRDLVWFIYSKLILPGTWITSVHTQIRTHVVWGGYGLSSKEWIWGGYQQVLPITPIPTLNMRDSDGEVDPWGQGGGDSNREKDGADEHGVGVS